MPVICLYDERDGEYRHVRDLRGFWGGDGPVGRLVAEVAPEEGGDDVPWALTEAELVRGVEPDSGPGARLVIDLKPSVKGNVSLYRVHHVWGLAHWAWCPMAVRLETIFSDREERDPAEFKRRFKPPTERGDLVHEFIYLSRSKHGRWSIGVVRGLNGALLWPETLEHFVRAIGETPAPDGARPFRPFWASR